VSAIAEAGRSPATIADDAEAAIMALVGDHVWGRDTDTWPDVLGRELAALSWNAALVEVGTGGSAAQLLGGASWVKGTRAIAALDPGADLPLVGLAREAGRSAGAWIGLGVRAVESGEDTLVELAAVGPWGVSESSQTAFLGGSEGRRRAGIAAAAFLLELLRVAAKGQQASAGPATGRQ
jgi:hypothetical protein